MVENKSISSCIRVAVIYFVVIVLGLICFFPLWNVVCISFSSSMAVSGNRVGMFPVEFTLIAYEKILENSQFWYSFGISVFRVVISLAINMSTTVLMAYPLSKTEEKFRGRNIYMYMLIFAMLFSGGMIPSYLVIKNLNLLNTVWALILPGAVTTFNVVMVMNFFIGLPKSMEEAAIIDGATPMQILFWIYVPCSKPSLATVALFNIVSNWNDFFSGLVYMTKIKNYPLMTYVQALNVDIKELVSSGASADSLSMVRELSNKNLNAAKIVVAVVPLLILYPFLQRYLITGMVVGSVKE